LAVGDSDAGAQPGAPDPVSQSPGAGEDHLPGAQPGAPGPVKAPAGAAGPGEPRPSVEPPDPGGQQPVLSEPRHLTDPRALRAVTHPVRLSILEMLELHGALTATEAGELIGESPTTCSFHLRQLAKYGFVEEAGGGAGRRRPWRLAARGMRITAKADDPEMSIAALALESLLVKRWMERFGEWERTRSHYAPEWQEAGNISETVAYMTPDELTGLMSEVFALFCRYDARLANPAARPEGSRPIEMVAFAFPFDLAGPGHDASRRRLPPGRASSERGESPAASP
jgi:DNA-binding transcriptional ArsR family regulator